jgi:putative DNA primase/helicase
LTAEAARIAQGLEWLATYRVDIRGLSWKRAKEVLEDAASRNLMVSQFAALWHAVEELLTEGPPESGRAVFGDHKIEGHVVRSIRQYGVERIAADWSKTPTLHIDATVDMELLRHRVPHAELIGEIEAAAPHVRIVQYPDRAFGKIALRNERLLFRVWDWCIAYAAQRGGDWGIIVPKDAETAIVAAREMPSFIKLHHFGALRGLDELKNVRGLIIVGRPMEGPDGVERIAGALSGRAVEPIAGDWYPAELVQLRAHDGGVASVEADRHPHPMAEAVRRSIAEGEVLQAIGRARGLNRKAENPVEIVLLGNVPVPGVIPDELRQWEGPNVDDEIFARFGAALESAGDAAAVASLKRDAVRVARQRLGTFSYKNYLYGNVPNLCSAIYQIAGPGRSRQGIVYDRRRIADCRAWLTERLGPLTYFAEIEAEQPAKPVTKVQILDIAAAPVVALGADPPFSEPVRSSDTVAARPCTWITDTSGERIQRCGELVADGRDYCPEHRHRHACAMAGVAIRPPMPVRPFPAGYAPVLMAAE